MKMTDSVDLESAKLVEVVTTRMVSNATMRIYLKAVGMFLVIYEISEGKWDTPILDNEGNETGKFTSHPAKELCLLIVKSLEGSTTDNNDFNFIIGHPKGDGIIADTKLLRDVTLTSHAAQIQALLDIVIGHCNKVTFPFKDVTQEEFDAAKAKLALVGELEAHSYTIGGFPTNEPDAFVIKTRELICDVIFDAPVPIDCTVKVTFQLLDAATGLYVPESIADSVRVSKDSRSKNYRIKRSFSARKMKCVATCSHNLPFQVKVREA
jgi:hypothetical protein